MAVIQDVSGGVKHWISCLESFLVTPHNSHVKHNFMPILQVGNLYFVYMYFILWISSAQALKTYSSLEKYKLYRSCRPLKMCAI